MEWGPRALGNRSILANPMNKNIKDILNLKIKLRENLDLLHHQCFMIKKMSILN